MDYSRAQLLTIMERWINERLEICRTQVSLHKKNIADLNQTLLELPRRRFIKRMTINSLIETGQIMLRTFEDQFQFHSEMLVDVNNGDACNVIGIVESKIKQHETAYQQSFRTNNAGYRFVDAHELIFRDILKAELAAIREMFVTDKKLCPKHSITADSRDYMLDCSPGPDEVGFGRWLDTDEA